MLDMDIYNNLHVTLLIRSVRLRVLKVLVLGDLHSFGRQLCTHYVYVIRLSRSHKNTITSALGHND